MKAKEYGEGYDLDATNVTITGANLTLTNNTGGVAQYDGQILANYSLYTELFVDESLNYGETPTATDYIRIQELELPFSKDNAHLFDLSATLKNFVKSDIFEIMFTGITALSDYMVSYYNKYGEKYPLVENTNTKKKRQKGTTGYGWAVNAALNFEDCNDMSDYFAPSGYTIISGITFLNTAPDTKYSHRNGDEILYFSVPQDYTYPMFVVANIYLYSGTEYLGVKMLDIKTGSTITGGVYGVSVGYNALGLDAYETAGERIRKIDIQIYQTIGGNTGYTYSDMKSYLFELDEQPDTFNVAFLSKLGTFETYSFYGEVVQGQEIDRATYQKPYGVSYCGEAVDGFEYNSILDTDFTKTWTVNTGIIDDENYNYLLGMLQSNKIYRYDDIHKNYLVPVSQTATKSTNTNEYSLQIVFNETISENNVTS